MTTIYLQWDDSQLLIFPSQPFIENELTYYHKHLVVNGRNSGTHKERVSVFEVISETNGIRTILTLQGFLYKVIRVCLSNGYPFQIIDQRLEFPAPKFERMGGFRFSQRELLEAALKKNQSGLIGAPTRYGKSTLLKNTLKAYPGVKTVVTLPGTDLIRQLYEDIKKSLPDRKVDGIFGTRGSRGQGDDITVVSMDSLHKCDHEGTRLVLVDEPHALSTGGRFPEFNKFLNARKIGYGATLSGRFDNADIWLEGGIGSVLAERTYKDAVTEGAICPLHIIFIRMPFTPWPVFDRRHAYNALCHQSREFAETVGRISSEIIPEEWQTIVFIHHEKQAELIAEHTGAEIAMAKRMTASERNEMFDRMRSAEIKRCAASNIYSTGTTMSELRCLINAAGGGGSISAIQKPGRLAEIRPDKKHGIVFDFLFEPVNQADGSGRDAAWRAVVADCWARFRTYKDKGYTMHTVDSVDAAKELFDQLNH